MENGSRDHLVLGTAGHIDHGKSSLIEALTGIDPDRLAEEKKRGITIELGFAQLDLGNGLTMGVVDVPGHERFVRQMIAGATGVDIALLCIAADDGIMPQTIEHLAVLELLGVRACVVALTKCDLADEEWLLFLEEEIRAHLATGPFAGAPIVAVSARNKTGLDELRDAIAAAAETTHTTHDSQSARLPIDRSFSIKGSGTVVTGTLWSGSIATGDKLQAYPGEDLFRVRGVQRHGEEVACAFAGNRIALNLAHAEKTDLPRGVILAAPGSLHITDRFDALFTYIGENRSSEPLRTGERVRIAHGTTEVFGRILLMENRQDLAARTTCLAQIRLDEALPVSRQDRFIVRSMSPVRVIGGGSVLHASPRRRTEPSPAEHALIGALIDDDCIKATEIALDMQTRPTTAREIAQTSGYTETETERSLLALQSSPGIVHFQGSPDRYIARTALQKKISAVDNALLTFHAKNPTQPGMAPEMLRNAVDARSGKESFKALLAHLDAVGSIVFTDGIVSHPKAQASTKRIETQAVERLHDLVSQAGGAAPTLAELMENSALDASLFYRAIGLLEKQKRAQRVGDYCFSAHALDAFECAIRSHIEKNGASTAAELKDAMKTSRKYAIPLLEHFDARGITRREGDTRTLA